MSAIVCNNWILETRGNGVLGILEYPCEVIFCSVLLGAEVLRGPILQATEDPILFPCPVHVRTYTSAKRVSNYYSTQTPQQSSRSHSVGSCACGAFPRDDCILNRQREGGETAAHGREATFQSHMASLLSSQERSGLHPLSTGNAESNPEHAL